jgi:UDP-3-O-acyl N-acetylglucosamine deacetylase
MPEPGRQTTLAARTSTLRGSGLQAGEPGSVTLAPGAAGTGFVFRRVDRPGYDDIPARIENLRQVPRCTAIGKGPAEVRVVEHVLAACVLAGVDNALIEVEGPEVPAADGSAALFLEMIQAAGVAPLDAPRIVLEAPAPLEVVGGLGDGWAFRVEPAAACSYTFRFRGGGALAGATASFAPGRDDPRLVAPARTFCFEAEIAALLAAGLGRGGNIESVLVLSSEGVPVNAMRAPLEPVRHKLLDLIGDLALAGLPIRAGITAEGTGHAAHAEVLHRLLSGLVRKEESTYRD